MKLFPWSQSLVLKEVIGARLAREQGREEQMGMCAQEPAITLHVQSFEFDYINTYKHFIVLR
jgi:hypothetical protein